MLLENTAGQGTNLGHRFEHLGEVLRRSKASARLGICFDTCHALAAGYDFRTQAGFRATVRIGVPILLIESKLWFYILASGIGLFIGPAQSASRSLMARLAEPEERTEMFGLYALSGRATAFLGPLLVGWLTLVSGSQRVGMATVVVFFLIGFLLLLPLRLPAHAQGAAR